VNQHHARENQFISKVSPRYGFTKVAAALQGGSLLYKGAEWVYTPTDDFKECFAGMILRNS
jgi:hypothetical protein